MPAGAGATVYDFGLYQVLATPTTATVSGPDGAQVSLPAGDLDLALRLAHAGRRGAASREPERTAP
jgi:hypothetical protein